MRSVCNVEDFSRERKSCYWLILMLLLIIHFRNYTEIHLFSLFVTQHQHLRNNRIKQAKNFSYKTFPCLHEMCTPIFASFPLGYGFFCLFSLHTTPTTTNVVASDTFQLEQLIIVSFVLTLSCKVLLPKMPSTLCKKAHLVNALRFQCNEI